MFKFHLLGCFVESISKLLKLRYFKSNILISQLDIFITEGHAKHLARHDGKAGKNRHNDHLRPIFLDRLISLLISG